MSINGKNWLTETNYAVVGVTMATMYVVEERTIDGRRNAKFI